MNNLDWLCENDREQLMKLLAEGDSCEYCALEIEDDCGVRCNEGVRAWLEAEHRDGLQAENGVSAEDVDYNDAKVIQIGEKYKLADGDTREKLEDVLRNHAVIAFADKESGNDGILMRLDEFRALLDRQKAIAEREQAERIRQLEQVIQADKDDCAQAFADMKVMENERDRARSERDKYRGQRDLYRKKLGDAVWHAQAIARMAEVDA